MLPGPPPATRSRGLPRLAPGIRHPSRIPPLSGPGAACLEGCRDARLPIPPRARPEGRGPLRPGGDPPHAIGGGRHLLAARQGVRRGVEPEAGRRPPPAGRASAQGRDAVELRRRPARRPTPAAPGPRLVAGPSPPDRRVQRPDDRGGGARRGGGDPGAGRLDPGHRRGARDLSEGRGDPAGDRPDRRGPGRPGGRPVLLAARPPGLQQRPAPGDPARLRGRGRPRLLPFDPDAELSVRPDGPDDGAVVASADSQVLDRCGPWFPLAAFVVEREVPGARLVDLSDPSTPARPSLAEGRPGQ